MAQEFIIYIISHFPYASFMITKENRRFPRIPHVTSQQIIRLDDSQNPQKNIILTQNLSACGIKFTTNEELGSSSYFLVYLNDLFFIDIQKNCESFLKSGNYYMARVVWSKQINDNKYEIGAAFLEKKTCKFRDLDTFTELVNVSMLDDLPEVMSHY